MNRVIPIAFIASVLFWGCGDTQTSKLCGNSKIDDGETCDPPDTCPTSCDDGDPCTDDSMSGSAETCNVECSNDVITDCADDDGCCAEGCNANNDNDCSPVCGNDIIEEGENCDPPADCVCQPSAVQCEVAIMTGDPQSCNIECSYVMIEECLDDDDCCPTGCNSNNDNDCIPACGNDVIEQGETCDPPASCPTDCDDSDTCTIDQMTGSPDNCNVACSHTGIVDCLDDDLCCPPGCNANLDNDCAPVCGNDIVEPGETCDPPATCPTDCDDSDPCTDDTMTGSDANCDADCMNEPITDCINDDGCCPATCDGTGDNDCGPPPEICTGGNDEDGDGFTDCQDLDCFGDPACADACAGAPVNIGCGDSLAGDTSAEANTLSWYSCLEWDETGGEIVYDFTGAQASEVTVSLAPDYGVDVDVFVLEADCRQDACTHYDDNQVTFTAVPGTTYYLVVDSFEARGGAYTIDVACTPITEDCNNGVDDDFDAQVDCDDGDCNGDPACPGNGRCSARFTVHCNDARFTSTTNDNQQPTDVIDSYSCIGWDESGPEVAWEFTAPQDGQVDVSIEYDTAERDLDLFVLEDQCAGDSCIQHGDQSLSFAATNGTTYYFVIDGRNGDYGGYTLRIYCQEICDNIRDDDGDGFADCADTDCHGEPNCAQEEGQACLTGVDEDADGQTDCDDPGCAGLPYCPASGECYSYGSNNTIACEGEYSGSTTAWGSTDVVNAYACTGNALAGPESAVLYSAAGGGQATATITADSTGGQLEVLVLEDACDGAACLSHGDDNATFTAQDGHDYYIVVDAPEGVVGTFTVQLDCLFEDCFDGEDNDGDTLADCDDPDCAGTTWCPPGVCQSDGAISCDETQNVTVTGEPNEVMYYPGCMGDQPNPGGELVRLFTTASPVQVGVMMMPQGPGMGWLMALEGECAGESCLMMGGAGIMFNAVPGKDYYIVIDGEGDFQLQTTCTPITADICVNGEDDDLDGDEDCADTDCQGTQACPADGRCVPRPQWWSIGCDQEAFGATSQVGATDVLNGYDCTDWDASGPEVVYTFVPEVSGQATVDLSHPAGIALDVYILQNDCASDACIAAGGTSVTFDAVKDKTYYIVVDGANGDAGTFTLTTSCAP